jgi:hypothetical protein
MVEVYSSRSSSSSIILVSIFCNFVFYFHFFCDFYSCFSLDVSRLYNNGCAEGGWNFFLFLFFVRSSDSFFRFLGHAILLGQDRH